MKTSGNTILITGGTSGIGQALARRWHEAGHQVIIAGRRQELIDDMTRRHPGMAGLVLDIEDTASIEPFAAQLLRDHPALNVVVHNAGVMTAEDLGADDWLATAERTVAINLLGPMRLTAALLPHLRRAASPAIVTVSSGLAFVPLALTPTYCATKAAIHSWSQSLRHVLKGQGIEVIELAPPAVQTDLMPGHATNPNIMTLPAFIDEVMSLLDQQPTPPEVLVKRVLFQRDAEREGRFDAAFAAINAPR